MLRRRYRKLAYRIFGRLIALVKVEKSWVCKCQCGNWTIVRTSNLSGGRTRSCGCLESENLATLGERSIRHGHSRHGRKRTPEYRAWSHAKGRCNNPKDAAFHRYGGRGIQMCDRWLNSFENFLEDMGPKPKGLTIDRINNNGNYEPENCRWATAQQQANNRSRPTKNRCRV